MASFTAEPGRKRAYDKDLRWRIVYQRIGMNYTYQRIAQNLPALPKEYFKDLKQPTALILLLLKAGYTYTV
jgi:hypothetical protein